MNCPPLVPNCLQNGCRNVLVPKCLGPKSSFGTGAELSRCRTVLHPSCPSLSEGVDRGYAIPTSRPPKFLNPQYYGLVEQIYTLVYCVWPTSVLEYLLGNFPLCAVLVLRCLRLGEVSEAASFCNISGNYREFPLRTPLTPTSRPSTPSSRPENMYPTNTIENSDCIRQIDNWTIKFDKNQDYTERKLFCAVTWTIGVFFYQFLYIPVFSLQKFFGRHHELVDRYETSVSQMRTDLFP